MRRKAGRGEAQRCLASEPGVVDDTTSGFIWRRPGKGEGSQRRGCVGATGFRRHSRRSQVAVSGFWVCGPLQGAVPPPLQRAIYSATQGADRAKNIGKCTPPSTPTQEKQDNRRQVLLVTHFDAAHTQPVSVLFPLPSLSSTSLDQTTINKH